MNTSGEWQCCGSTGKQAPDDPNTSRHQAKRADAVSHYPARRAGYLDYPTPSEWEVRESCLEIQEMRNDEPGIDGRTTRGARSREDRAVAAG
jgi:hypothetical protein